MPRLLQITDSYQYTGGIRSYIRQATELLAGRGWEVEIFSPPGPGGDLRSQFTRWAGWRYLAEVREGQTVAVRTRLLGRSAKRIHFMHFLVNEAAANLAATLESLGTHADMRRRRSAPVPEDVAAKIDAILERHRRFAWQAPVCGVIHV